MRVAPDYTHAPAWQHLPVERRTKPRHNAFDGLWVEGEIRAWLGLPANAPWERPTVGRQPVSEELRTKLYAAVEDLTETHQQYVRGIMSGQSVRQQAADLGVQHPAVVKGRQRALEVLREKMGVAT